MLGAAVAALHIVVDDHLKLFSDMVTAQRHGLFPIDEHRGSGLLAGAWKADTNVRVLAFARTVDDAPHDSDIHFLDARIA